jgi:raffinose/stachyose/melibiose transport system substrate-binding protein
MEVKLKKILFSSFIVVLCLTVAMSLFLAGCKTTTTETTAAATTAAATTAAETTAAETTAAAQPITLEFWSWNNEGAYPKVHEDAEKRFMAKYPNVTIKRDYISYADYMVKLKAALAGGQAPDIFQIPWAGEYTEIARSGKIEPMTEYLKKDFPAFFENVMKAISVDGDAWAIPLDLNTLQIAYNVTKFKELGVEIPKSQDELISLAATLKGKGLFGIAQGTKDLWTGGDSFFAEVAYTDPTHTKMAAADAGTIGWDDAVFVDAINAVDKLIKAGVYAPGANSMEAFVGAEDLFVQQKSAMFYPVGNFVTGGVTEKVAGAFEYSLFPTPPLKAGDEALPTGGVAEMFVVSKDSKNIDMAVEFLRFLTNDDGKTILAANDFIPSSDYTGDTSKFSPLYKNMLDAQSKSQSRVVYNTKVYQAILNGMQGVFGQELSPADFIKSLVEAAKG